MTVDQAIQTLQAVAVLVFGSIAIAAACLYLGRVIVRALREKEPHR